MPEAPPVTTATFPANLPLSAAIRRAPSLPLTVP
jgi:hypothetical protein